MESACQNQDCLYFSNESRVEKMKQAHRSLIEGESTIGEGKRLYIPSNLRNVKNGLWNSRDKPFELSGVLRAEEPGIFLWPWGYQKPYPSSARRDSFYDRVVPAEEEIDKEWRIVLRAGLMKYANIRIFDKVNLYVGQGGLEVWNTKSWRRLKYGYCVIHNYWLDQEKRRFFRDFEWNCVFCRDKSIVTRLIKENCYASWQRKCKFINFATHKFSILEFTTKCFLITGDFLLSERFSFNRIEESLRFYDTYLGLGVPEEIEEVRLERKEAVIGYERLKSLASNWRFGDQELNSIGKKVFGIFENLSAGVYVLRELVEKE